MDSKDVEIELKGQNRYKMVKSLANTLQGRIYLAQDKRNNDAWVVIKETWKELVKQGKSRDGHKVPENFAREKEIQLYLSNLVDQSPGYVRCMEDWEDENCYYLAMEYCGAGELFDFIRDNHTKGELSKIVSAATNQEQKCEEVPSEWSLCVQSMFRQLVDTVSWMHSNGVVHLDLSLENTMLASVNKYDAKIKIIDFGVARRVTGTDTLEERVGKVGYMAPEVYAKKKYSPEKADIWCLAVMLFMMLVGAPPYECANATSPAFRFIILGRLRDVLVHWRRLPLVSADALDVMERIFKPEEARITMAELKEHKYVKMNNSKEVKVSAETTSVTTNDEARYSKTPPKTTDQITNEPLKIKLELIPNVTTRKATEISQKLQSTVGIENFKVLAATIKQSIEEMKQSIKPPSSENANEEGVVDVNDARKHDEKCIDELRALQQLVADTIQNNSPK